MALGGWGVERLYFRSGPSVYLVTQYCFSLCFSLWLRLEGFGALKGFGLGAAQESYSTYIVDQGLYLEDGYVCSSSPEVASTLVDLHRQDLISISSSLPLHAGVEPALFPSISESHRTGYL